MHCPTCAPGTAPLGAVRLEPGLAVLGCKTCEGYLVSVLAFRAWAERNQAADAPPAHRLTAEAQDSAKALHCPKCARIMTKYRIDDEVKNRLDLCGHCGEIWLDGGEWALLGSLDLQAKLPTIFTEPWQRSVRRDAQNRNAEARLAARIGPLDVERVREFAKWLNVHPHAADLRRLLIRADD